jgi:hypothetical protein
MPPIIVLEPTSATRHFPKKSRRLIRLRAALLRGFSSSDINTYVEVVMLRTAE